MNFPTIVWHLANVLIFALLSSYFGGVLMYFWLREMPAEKIATLTINFYGLLVYIIVWLACLCSLIYMVV